MNIRTALFLSTLCLASAVATASEGVITQMLAQYKAEGAGEFSTAGVDTLWNKKVRGDDGTERSCASCHHSDLKLQGAHDKTGKVIEPMAFSVNPTRYQDAEKIEKWFLRNCKGTWGRECTPQEKGNFLTYLKSQ